MAERVELRITRSGGLGWSIVNGLWSMGHGREDQRPWTHDHRPGTSRSATRPSPCNHSSVAAIPKCPHCATNDSVRVDPIVEGRRDLTCTTARVARMSGRSSIPFQTVFNADGFPAGGSLAARTRCCAGQTIDESALSGSPVGVKCKLVDPNVDADAAVQRFAFLARAGEVLASSLDYEQTLQDVARLAVPTLCDVCIVDIVEDGVLRACRERTCRAGETRIPRGIASAISCVRRFSAARRPRDAQRRTGAAGERHT